MNVHTVVYLLCLFALALPVICDENITSTEMTEDNDMFTIEKIPFIIKLWLFKEIMFRII